MLEKIKQFMDKPRYWTVLYKDSKGYKRYAQIRAKNGKDVTNQMNRIFKSCDIIVYVEL